VSAAEACRQLIQILPNLRGPKQKTWKVLTTVVTSRLLYGAPFWFPSISAKALSKMETAYGASSVVSSMPPLKLPAQERVNVYQGIDKEDARNMLMANWQVAWNNADKGRLTHGLIGDLRQWVRRKHGEVSFHLCQMMMGHGCFNDNLYRFGNSTTRACSQCGTSPDTAEHAVFECDAFYRC